MKLAPKITVSLLLTTGLLFFALVAVTRYIIYNRFQLLQDQVVLEASQAIRRTVQSQGRHLHVFVTDWSVWDDTCRFVEDLNEEFIAENIVTETFKNAGLAAMVFMDTNAVVRFTAVYDAGEDTIATAPEAARAFTSVLRQPRFRVLSREQAFAGLIRLQERVFLVAASPILPSKGAGATHGTMVAFRLLDRALMEEFQVLLGHPLRLLLAEPGAMQKEARHVAPGIFLMPSTSDQINGLVSLVDLDRVPQAWVVFQKQNVLLEHQRLMAQVLTLCVLVMSVAYLLMMLFLVQRNIIKRLQELSLAIRAIQDSKDPQRRVQAHGNDELADLGRSFNEAMTELALVQAELRQHDAYLNSLFNIMNVGILVIDEETHIIRDANISALNMIGGRWDQVVGQKCQDFICATGRDQCPAQGLTEAPMVLERPLRTLRQDIVPVLKSVTRLAQDGRQLLIESMINISEQKRVEQALRHRIALEAVLAETAALLLRKPSSEMDALIEQAMARVALLTGTDRCHVLLYAEDRQTLFNSHEWSREGVARRKTQLRCIPAETFQGWMRPLGHQQAVHIPAVAEMPGDAEPLKKFLQQEGIGALLAVPIQREGSLLGLVSFEAVRDAHHWREEDINLLNVMAGIIASALMRRQYDEDMTQAADRYQAIFEHSGAGAVLTDKDGHIELANQEFLRLTGCEDQDVIGKLWVSFFIPERGIAPGRADAEVRIMVMRLRSPGPENRFVQAAITEIPGAINQMVFISDITDRIRAEKALQEANRIKAEFLANISHEIRTPLNCIIGYAEVLLDANNWTAVRQQARTILRESEDLQALFGDVLEASRLDAGRLDINPHPYAVAEFVERLRNAIQVRCAEKFVGFSIELDNRLPPYLMGDDHRLRQVLSNLLINAVKFTAHGHISLQITRLADNPLRIRYLVSDTGIGIPADKLKAVFEPFNQADGSIRRRYGGAGLGLTIVQRLVQLMGGTVEVASQEGKGTQFWFDLHQERAEPPIPLAETSAAPVPASLRGCRVLVVEDSEVIQDLARLHLTNAGCEVTSAMLAREGLALCEQHAFHVILMDIQMPEMDGLQATRLIRAGNSPNRQTPILAVTAAASDRIREDCLAAGMNELVLKPFRKQTLLNMVQLFYTPTQAVAPDQAPPPPPARVEVLDWQEALREFGGNKKMLLDLFGKFMRPLPEQLERLAQALATGDWEPARRIAHKIRGAAGNLQAQALAQAAAALEEALLARATDGAAGLLAAIRRETGLLQAALEPFKDTTHYVGAHNENTDRG